MTDWLTVLSQSGLSYFVSDTYHFLATFWWPHCSSYPSARLQLSTAAFSFPFFQEALPLSSSLSKPLSHYIIYNMCTCIYLRQESNVGYNIIIMCSYHSTDLYYCVIEYRVFRPKLTSRMLFYSLLVSEFSNFVWKQFFITGVELERFSVACLLASKGPV